MIKRMLFIAVFVELLPGMAAAAANPPADFRIENQVFVGKKKEPAAKSTTIFYRGVVYDFLATPAEVTIYDPAKNRFILLDLDRKLKTELSTETIEKMLKHITKLAEKSKDPKIRFLYHPKFQESFVKQTGELVLESDLMTYRVKGEPAGSDDLAKQYRRFCDAYAKLNTYLRPGSRPPFARLIVDEAIEKRKEIPKEIVLVLKMRRKLTLRPDILRSEHRLIKRLLESDHRRIEQAGAQMAKFKAVSFCEYEARARKGSSRK